MIKKKRGETKRAEAVYGELFKQIIVPMVGNTTTNQSTLSRVGAIILGTAFRGVFAADRIPPLTHTKKYAIANLDNHGGPGSHWVGLVREGKDIILYDSFARTAKRILPELKAPPGGRIIMTDRDIEQRDAEKNCGARTLAWLLLFKQFGREYAMAI